MADMFTAPKRVDVMDPDAPDVFDLSAPELLSGRSTNRRRLSHRQILAVVVIMLAALGIAGGVGVAALLRQQVGAPSSPQWTAVVAYMDALRAQDATRLRAATTDDVEWRGYDANGILVAGPYRGEDYFAVQRGAKGSYHYVEKGQPTVDGNTVTVLVRVELGRYGALDAVLIVQVRQAGSQLRVARVSSIPVVEATPATGASA